MVIVSLHSKWTNDYESVCCVHTTVCLQMSVNNFVELVLLFHLYIRLTNYTQVSRFCGYLFPTELFTESHSSTFLKGWSVSVLTIAFLKHFNSL